MKTHVITAYTILCKEATVTVTKKYKLRHAEQAQAPGKQ